MDANVVMQIVGQYGFPILACGAMAYYVKYREDKHSEEMARRDEMHKSEMDGITQSLNNNTIALTKLCEKLEGGTLK